MGRVGLVDPQPHLARVRDQPRRHQRVARGFRTQLLLLGLIGRNRCRIVQPGLDRVCRPHRGARAQEGRPAGEARPRLVPQEDQVGLDGKAFLHHAPRVVHVAVEGAVGQVQHLDPVQPALIAQVQKRLLDRGQRNRAIHRILRQREGFDVKRLAPGQHHSVVVRLVAVAVHDHDVAGRHQRLHHHLVRGRGSVRDEEHVVSPKGAGRHLLRFLDVARRLQQAVEAPGRGAAFRKEQVDPVELAHVADPVGPEHRLAPRDGQGVERADGALRVFLQVVEERRLIAVLDAFKNGEVQFQQFLHRVEDAPGAGRRRVGGELFHLAVGGHVDVQIGAHALQQAREPQRGLFFRDLAQGLLDHPAQHRGVVAGPERHAFGRDHGKKLGVHDGGADRILETAHDDGFVDERILDPAQAAQFGADRGPAGWRLRADQKHLEIGPVHVAPRDHRG